MGARDDLANSPAAVGMMPSTNLSEALVVVLGFKTWVPATCETVVGLTMWCIMLNNRGLSSLIRDRNAVCCAAYRSISHRPISFATPDVPRGVLVSGKVLEFGLGEGVE